MMMIDLLEWGRVGPDSDRRLAGRSLASHPAGRGLAQELTRNKRMEVLELQRGVELRATSFVGRFSLGELTVTVRPKIPGAPLLSLFRYAYGLRHLDNYEVVDFTSSPWCLQDLLIQQLAAEASELLTRGIHRDYERTRADLASPRGRIDFTRYVNTAQRAETALPCMHHPRSEDTLLNRVLLAGLVFAAGLAVDDDLKWRVRRLGRMLGATVSAELLNSAVLADAWRVMDRRTTAYQPALTLIDLLLGGQGLGLDEEGRRVRLSGFLFDMNRFFQALVSRFLREHLADLDVQDEYRLKGMINYAPGQNPRARRAPTPRPDFVVMRKKEVLAVLDAKYRDLWEETLPREMLYQLALYALGGPGQQRTSAILYPTVAPGAREQGLTICEPVRGDPQARVSLRPLNLLELEHLLSVGSRAHLQRVELAQRLAFGNPTGSLAA